MTRQDVPGVVAGNGKFIVEAPGVDKGMDQHNPTQNQNGERQGDGEEKPI